MKDASRFALESPPIHSLYSPFSCPQVISLRVKERSSGERLKVTFRLSPVIHSFLFFEQSKAFLAFYSNSGRRIEYVSMKKENLFTTISILHW